MYQSRMCKAEGCSSAVPFQRGNGGYCNKTARDGSKVGHWNEAEFSYWGRPHCECGSDKMREFGLPQPGHSYFCPLLKY